MGVDVIVVLSVVTPEVALVEVADVDGVEDMVLETVVVPLELDVVVGSPVVGVSVVELVKLVEVILDVVAEDVALVDMVDCGVAFVVVGVSVVE